MDLYNEEMSEINILTKYLPEEMSIELLITKISYIINDMNATSIKDMGKVIGRSMKELSQYSDGKTISNIVKDLLK